MSAAPDGGDPLERVEQGDRREVWRGRHGSLLTITWVRGAALFSFDGHGDGRYARPIVERFDALRAQTEACQMFFDAWAMASYDSALRVDLTESFRKHRPSIAQLHVGTRSKIVAMGVTIANMALGGLITAHTNRVPFVAAMREAGLDVEL